MISLNVLFYIFIALFAVIGMIRGFRKEIIVTVSGILSLFIIAAVLPKILEGMDGTKEFYFNILILFACTFFGYQTPNFQKIIARFERESMLDLLLGGISGALNGYIFFSSAWYYMAKAGYPFNWITPPDGNTEVGRAALALLENSFPNMLTGTWLYIALAASVMIVIAVIL
ncbi:MAG: CvpA family protein [Anaerolineaceae bacterium]|jgi:uncharacterized membrane protein required for colicin V production